jgi:hypothetical protein
MSYLPEIWKKNWTEKNIKKDRGKPSTDYFDNAKRRASIYEVSLNLRLLSGFQSYRNASQ